MFDVAEERQLERQLGEAENTGKVDKSAAHAYAAYRRYLNLPPQPTPTEIEGDNAENEMANYCIFLSTRHFPYKFDHNLNPPPNSKSNRCLTAVTLGKYAGKALKSLRRLDPKHPDWESLSDKEFPSWWPSMLNSMKEEIDRL